MMTPFFGRRRAAANGQIHVEPLGLQWTDGKTEVRLGWGDIEEVIAFKRDELTYDTIYAELVSGDGRRLLISEEEEGFSELMVAMRERLPNFRSDWHAQVAHPAFDQNRTILYKRS